MLSARDIANAHAERLKAGFGDAITPAKSVECERAAEMLAIADAIRTRIVDEGVGDFSALERAEDMAAKAVLALGVPKPKVHTIRVLYDFDAKLMDMLKDVSPELVKDVLVTEMAGRITELEAKDSETRLENEQLKRAFQSARDDQTRGVLQVTPDQINAPAASVGPRSVRTPQAERSNADQAGDRFGDTFVGVCWPSGGVAIADPRSGSGLAMSRSLEERYGTGPVEEW
jgi:hypothetical protein